MLPRQIVFGCLIFVLAGCVNPSKHAQTSWEINNARSSLSFVSIKAGNVAETHRFASFAGKLSKQGQLVVEIDTHSVDTAIPIRDQRMRQHLFSTPTAVLTANVEMATLNTISPGASMSMDVVGTLKLNQVTSEVPLSVEVTKVDDGLLVHSARPVLLNGASLGLESGIDKLREVAGLPSISLAVPLTFLVHFEENN